MMFPEQTSNGNRCRWWKGVDDAEDAIVWCGVYVCVLSDGAVFVAVRTRGRKTFLVFRR